MKSNFEFLDKEFPVLSQFGKKAEAYLYSDSNSCLMKLGMIGETVVNLMFTYDRIMLLSENTAVNRISVLFREGLLTQDLVDILHALQRYTRTIVDRIESLFAKLDESKQKAQDALDSFEIRKAAILHKAFTGELTAQWRKEHGVGMESWDNTTLSKIVIGFKYGTSEKSDYSYKGMPVFRIPNIADDGLSFEDLKFLSHKDISDENQIHENDI